MLPPTGEPMAKLEDILVRELAAILEPKFSKIYTNKKPSASPKFKARIEERLGYIPILQPEIDICVVDREGALGAVEVKVFKGSEFTFRTPFYEGIGQALALHRYGFDGVALWFLFPGTHVPGGIDKYGPEAWSFIRKDLALPLDFSYVFVEELPEDRVYHVMQYSGRQRGYKLCPIEHPKFVLKWRYGNPIKHLPVQTALRETLEWWLDT
jgi:hypothetical protein